MSDIAYESNGLILVPANAAGARHARRHNGQRIEIVTMGHSPAEHGFAFAYLDWLFEQNQKEYDDPEVFRYQVSLDIDHVEIYRVHMVRQQIERLLEQCEARGGWVDLRVPKSWSHGRSHHEEFHALTQRLGLWGLEHTGVGLDEWRKLFPRYRSA